MRSVFLVALTASLLLSITIQAQVIGRGSAEPMQKTKRRDFVKATVSTAVAMGSPWPLTACRGSAQEPSPETNAQVAAIRGSNFDSMTRDAIEKIRGPGTLKECQNSEFSTNSYILEPFWQECQPS